MLNSKLSGLALTSMITLGSLGFIADEASAKPNRNAGGGQSIGTCSLTDVNLFSDTVIATQCDNFDGNDDTQNFEAFGQTWTFLGKDEDGTVTLNPEDNGEIKSADWFVQDDLKELADSLVVVLKASKYYSAYLFEDLAQYSSAVDNGTLTLDGVTQGGKAGLSHVSLYYAPRQDQPGEEPVTVPEPTAAVGLLAVAGFGFWLKRSQIA